MIKEDDEKNDFLFLRNNLMKLLNDMQNCQPPTRARTNSLVNIIDYY